MTQPGEVETLLKQVLEQCSFLKKIFQVISRVVVQRSKSFIHRLAFWAEWLASLRHLSLKATNFAKPIIISDRKLNSKKIGSVWISFRFNHFLAI